MTADLNELFALSGCYGALNRPWSPVTQTARLRSWLCSDDMGSERPCAEPAAVSVLPVVWRSDGGFDFGDPADPAAEWTIVRLVRNKAGRIVDALAVSSYGDRMALKIHRALLRSAEVGGAL
ncbi:MAG TPA: hypothetical protein VIL65_12805 [Beijerinckiaceae bacterium]|jgi:hypothetical protein